MRSKPHLVLMAESELQTGVSPTRMAALWGMERDDSARRLARELGVPKLSRGKYDPSAVLEIRQARIESALIPRDHLPEVAEAA